MYECGALNLFQRAVHPFVVFTEFLENFEYFQNDFKAIDEIHLAYDLYKINAIELSTVLNKKLSVFIVFFFFTMS